MKVLLITSKEEDYLQDSIIHGFKRLMGKDAIDFPVKDMLYDDYGNFKDIRGNGFTLYGLLNSDLKSQEKTDIDKEIASNRFDLVIFSSIYRQYELFYKYFKLLKKSRAVVWIMDGEDSPVIFPYLGKDLKKFLFSPKPHRQFTYFKRELLPETLNSVYFRFPASSIIKISLPKNIQSVSFSIPNEKIIDHQPIKVKQFVQHIVDKEVAGNVYRYNSPILFNSEEDYYEDIRKSKFGITTKRAGWDCLRHYEIAANGTVICFKDLKFKPESCAPHGLINGVNCISYSDYTDLTNQVNNLTDADYKKLQSGGMKWVKENTTVVCVNKLLNNYFKKSN